MAKRTAVTLSQWRRKADGTICGIPLGVPLPHSWASSVKDDMLNPDSDRWESIGRIDKGTVLDSAGPPRCMPVDDGTCIECHLGPLMFFTTPGGVEDF